MGEHKTLSQALLLAALPVLVVVSVALLIQTSLPKEQDLRVTSEQTVAAVPLL